MRKKLRLLPLLLLFLLLPGLAGCGGDDSQPYRVIEKLGTVQYGTVFRAGDRSAEPVIAAVRVLAANGKLSELSSGWLGSDIICLDGDAAALDDIRPALEARTLIVGVEESFCPIAYESDGEYIGLAVDMAKAIGELLGWEIRIQPISGTQLSAQLASGNIDCALGFGVEGLWLDIGLYVLTMAGGFALALALYRSGRAARWGGVLLMLVIFYGAFLAVFSFAAPKLPIFMPPEP